MLNNPIVFINDFPNEWPSVYFPGEGYGVFSNGFIYINLNQEVNDWCLTFNHFHRETVKNKLYFRVIQTRKFDDKTIDYGLMSESEILHFLRIMKQKQGELISTRSVKIDRKLQKEFANFFGI